jgi:endonuclease/exonuclease/phosphatase family metal-dependent hydrolase
MSKSFVAAALLCACASPNRQESGAQPTRVPLQRLSVLTHNTLHGLDVGHVWVTEVESKEARAARFNLHVQQLAYVQPDVVLLQEVNPLPDMARAYVEALRGFALEYQEVHQVDACGIRLGPIAVVPNLNNGLAVLVKAPLQLRKLRGLKLSGGWGGCRDSIGFQTGEFRYALIAEVVNPATQRKILAVSLHLHSGIERDAYFLKLVEEAKRHGRVDYANAEAAEQLEAALRRDQERRIQELHTLARELRAVEKKGSYIGAVIGGDFNFEPDSPEYRELERLGFRDIYTMAHHDDDLDSYDPRNPLAARQEEGIPSELSQALEGLPEAERQKVIEKYREGISRKRRIDFLFSMPMTTPQRQGCLQHELFGRPDVPSDQTASDHYGVLATYRIAASCP